MTLDTLREDRIVMPDGDVLTRSAIVQSSINFYKEKYQQNLTDICDFSEGSEIRTLHESWAVELFAKYRHSETKAKQKYVKYATGYYLDLLACEYHLTRRRSAAASGTVTFTTSANINGSMVVSKGTVILSRTTGYEYILQDDIIITSPNTPVNGTVYSKLTGADYNAAPDTLTAFQDIEAQHTEIQVTNPSELTGGLDGEEDDTFRERILAAKQETAYGTATAYENLIFEYVDDVHDVQFVDPQILTEDEKYPRHYKKGTTSAQIKGKTFAQLKSYLCTECTAVLFVNSYTKPIPEDTLKAVDALMIQQNNLVVGQKFHIEPAQLTKLYFTMELFVTATIEEATIYEHLKAFFDGGDVDTINGRVTYRGLHIGESLVKSRLLDVLEDIPGIHQVGYLKQIKYDSNIPTSINEWNNNGDSGFTYNDDEGYNFWRRYSSSPIPVWGSRNFSTLTTEKGCVFSLGQKKDLDKSTKTIFTISMKKVNDKGELI